MKTPLPGKINYDFSDYTIRQTFNQLITYLAELTEVVEGKQEYTTSGSDREVNVFNVGDLVAVRPTPTLKEQLLGEIKSLSVHYEEDEGWVVNYKEVEAIINRLIP